MKIQNHNRIDLHGEKIDDDWSTDLGYLHDFGKLQKKLHL